MKYFIASDIHGSAYYCERMLEAYEREKADKLILLGDLLYHGPRNDLPRGYDPKRVIELLNAYKKYILCVRGNCDSEVDQMVLEFPITAEQLLLSDGAVTVLATHGHKFSIDNLPPMSDGGVLLYGHTHVPMFEKKGSILCVNPGSVSIPKENSSCGYLVLENGVFVRKSLDGDIENSAQV